MAAKKLTRKEKAQQQAPAAADKALGRSRAAGSRRLAALLGGIVAVTGFLLYANTLGHGYVLDDYSVIQENRLTRQGWDAFPEIFVKSYRFGYYFVQDELYRPVPKALFAVQWALWPDNPAPGHWLNVLLYALTGWLLFRVLRSFTGGKLLPAFVVAMLFIAHPIHTEVVANIKSLDEVLSLLFFLVSLAAAFRYARSGRVKHLAGAMAAYLLSLFSKESGITLVAVYPLWFYFFRAGDKASRIRIGAAMVAVAAVFLAIRQGILSGQLKEHFSLADNLLTGIHDPLTRFATAVHILGLYLKQLVFPHPLVFDKSYDQIPPVTVAQAGFWVPLILYAALAVVAAARFRRREPAVLGVAVYLVTLSIFSNLVVTIGTSYGERLLFLPSLGFALATGFLICRARRAGEEPTDAATFLRAQRVVLGICGLVVAAYAVKTVTRNMDWKDNYTLFSHDVHLSPRSTRTHYYLGNYMTKPENIGVDPADTVRMMRVLDSAIVELGKAVAIYDRFCDVYKQMGVAYGKKKDLQRSFEFYSKAVQCNPTDAPSHSNLGTIYFEQGRYQEALKAFLEATRLDPNYTEALLNAGSAYGMLNDYPNALKYLHRCIETDPGYTQAYYFLSITYGFMGDRANADAYMQQYRRLGGQR